MPSGLEESRVNRTYSILKITDQMITEIASATFRGKANVIDLAIANLHAYVCGENQPVPQNSEHDKSNP